MAYIEFNDVVKEYPAGSSSIRALDGASFAADEGELSVILGQSGAGKTTALNILGGMDTATSGRVIVGGRDITDLNHHDLVTYRRNDIGFVFQFHHLLVVQGIDFGLGFPQAVALFQKFFFLLFISIHFFVDVFFLLDQTPFIFAEFRSSFFIFPLHFGPETVDFFLGFQQRFLLLGIACFLGIFQDLFGCLFCRADFPLSYIFTSQISPSNA